MLIIFEDHVTLKTVLNCNKCFTILIMFLQNFLLNKCCLDHHEPYIYIYIYIYIIHSFELINMFKLVVGIDFFFLSRLI